MIKLKARAKHSDNLELRTKVKELVEKVKAQLQVTRKPRDEKQQDEKKDGKDSKEKSKEEKREKDKKGADSTRNDSKLSGRGSLDKKKSEGPGGGTAPKKASEEPDLFGSMFGSKDKKKLPTGPPPSTMRTVPVGLF